MPPTSWPEVLQWPEATPSHKLFAKWAIKAGYTNVNDALLWFGDNVGPDYEWKPTGEYLDDAATHDPEAAKWMKLFNAYEDIVFDWPEEYRLRDLEDADFTISIDQLPDLLNQLYSLDKDGEPEDTPKAKPKAPPKDKPTDPPEDEVDEARVNDINFGHTVGQGSWIVYDPQTKQIKKRFKTHTAGKSYAKTHNLGFASSEFYFDRVKGSEVAEDNEHEGVTVKNSLHTIIRVATHLEKQMGDDEDFPEWVSEKIGSVKDQMVGVMDYEISDKEVKGLDEDFDLQPTELMELMSFLREYAVPIAAFSAVVAAYGLHKAVLLLKAHKGQFTRFASNILNKIDQRVVQPIASKLTDIQSKMAEGVAEGLGMWGGGDDNKKSKTVSDLERSRNEKKQSADRARAEERDRAWWKAQDDAAKAGKDTFEFDGKTHPIKEEETDYSKRRQRERDIDAGKPVEPEDEDDGETDYSRRRAQQKKELELGESTNYWTKLQNEKNTRLNSLVNELKESIEKK
jgi:hypothetical protein